MSEHTTEAHPIGAVIMVLILTSSAPPGSA